MFVALIVLAVAFLALGGMRLLMAPPRPRWLMPAIVGVATAAVLWRFAGLGALAGALAAALVFWLQRDKAPAVALDIAQARALLGVGETASRDDIRAAHRRLIAQAHPDRGGANDQAARLNAARDVLLKIAEK